MLTFSKGGTPAANRFWSLTAYTPNALEPIPNRLGKYVVGSYTRGLETNDDGSISIDISRRKPSGVARANWLPVGRRQFNVMLRVNGVVSGSSVADNTYRPPAVTRRVDSSDWGSPACVVRGALEAPGRRRAAIGAGGTPLRPRGPMRDVRARVWHHAVPMTTRSTPPRPTVRPRVPHFSSGPCAKPPGWSPELLADAAIGRSHRSAIGKAKLAEVIDLTREVLGVPESHLIGIVPASDTGAVEMALWSLLGARPVDALAWESFGDGWITDVVKQLRLEDVRTLRADYGELPDLGAVDWDRDVVFTWNGTTSGVRVPDAEWIAEDRKGLAICDATSAVFAQDVDIARLDVVTFSWQKVLGGEGAHGILILGPRAVERLQTYLPPWPLPKVFRLTKKGELIGGIFRGETINTPSMLCVEDALVALRWARDIGGLPALRARADANLGVIDAWTERTPWVRNLAARPETRSNTSVCLALDAPETVPKAMTKLLDAEGVAYDIGAYRDAPPGLRIWCGATVETSDVEALVPWLEWAHAEAAAS